LRILVVDDDPDLRRLLAVFLRARGHECLVAGDGAEGLAQVSATAPDAVITDVNMPGMDGLEMLRQLRSGDRSNLPVVVYSACAADAVCPAARQAGAQVVLRKPASLHDILAAVERACRGTADLPDGVKAHALPAS
jgi:DNA-binding response OmpR family regulator